MTRIIGRIDGAPGRRVVVSVGEGGGGTVTVEMAMDGTTMRMDLDAGQAATLEQLIALAQFRSWFRAHPQRLYKNLGASGGKTETMLDIIGERLAADEKRSK